MLYHIHTIILLSSQTKSQRIITYLFTTFCKPCMSCVELAACVCCCVGSGAVGAWTTSRWGLHPKTVTVPVTCLSGTTARTRGVSRTWHWKQHGYQTRPSPLSFITIHMRSRDSLCELLKSIRTPWFFLFIPLVKSYFSVGLLLKYKKLPKLKRRSALFHVNDSLFAIDYCYLFLVHFFLLNNTRNLLYPHYHW